MKNKITFEITFVESGRRAWDGKVWDVIDYRFGVSNGQTTREVKVGITGVFHDPAGPLGLKELSREELIEAAGAWLRSRLEKGECNPSNGHEGDSAIDVPSPVVEYWMEHHSVPHWI